MQKLTTLLMSAVLMFTFSTAMAGEAAPQKVVDFVNSEVAKLGSDPVIVAATKAQNAKGTSLGDIKSLDDKWKAHAGTADYMQALMDSECGKHMAAYQDKNSFVAEMFLTDNQGANVAMTGKTSDYWQGDEAKFTKSFTGGAGTVFMGDVEFDDSTQVYVVQASIPVVDGGKVIGVLVVGIDVDKAE
jgi:hypothetical protein